MAGTVFRIPGAAPIEAREFYDDKIHAALADCESGGYGAMFMPELVDAKIAVGPDSGLWKSPYTSASLRALGKSRQGNEVVLFAHLPHYYNSSTNIRSNLWYTVFGGAGVLPREEFDRLLGLEDGRNVFVVDCSVIWDAPRGVMSVSDALRHPQTAPFLGGRDRAEKYLEAHARAHGDRIEIWYRDDPTVLRSTGGGFSESCMARLLFLGIGLSHGLDGANFQSNVGRFLGVRRNAHEPPEVNL